MKNYQIALISLCLLFSSCAVKPYYFGEKLAPTTNVDIYYSTHNISKQYKIIGHISYSPTFAVKQSVIEAKLTACAKTVGADAIVIPGENNSTADAIKYANQSRSYDL